MSSNKEKVKFWLTSSTFTDFEHLKMRPSDMKLAEVEDCNSCLWFGESEGKEAKEFYLGLKRWIFHNYPYKNRLSWLNEEWASKADDFE